MHNDKEFLSKRSSHTPFSLQKHQQMNFHKKNQTTSSTDEEDLYKTELCKPFISGKCEYGDECQFAHGIHELRARNFGNMKYKTIACKNYSRDHYCRFGSRCKFLHDEQRIQVSENVFYLISPSDNLVYVEIYDESGTKFNSDPVPYPSQQQQYYPPPSSSSPFLPPLGVYYIPQPYMMPTLPTTTTTTMSHPQFHTPPLPPPHAMNMFLPHVSTAYNQFLGTRTINKSGIS